MAAASMASPGAECLSDSITRELLWQSDRGRAGRGNKLLGLQALVYLEAEWRKLSKTQAAPRLQGLSLVCYCFTDYWLSSDKGAPQLH